MTTQKPADKQSIKDCALSLILANGSTTNLDIKNKLRADGYWVSQDEVSSAMSTIASEENLDRAWSGTYNTWSLPAIVNTATVQDTSIQDTIDVIQPVTNTSQQASIDVIDVIARKLGIYKQAISQKSNLVKDLGFIDRDYATIGAALNKDIKDCKNVQDIINLI